MSDSLILGTRGSALALVQSHWVRDRLMMLNPGLEIKLSIIQTSGDKSQVANTPLSSYSEKGIFAKELELALLAGDIDFAVHSMKDMSSILPDGLHIAAVPPRQDVRDAIVGRNLADLTVGSRVGTGSVRRSALLRHHYPHLEIAEIRGNVDTRIKKLREGQYDSIVLAVAGLNRLGRSSEISVALDPNVFVPDPGQGALAIECRRFDERTNALLKPLSDENTFAAITAERAFLAAFGGGCQTPVGAWASVADGQVELIAMAAIDNSAPRYVRVAMPASDPAKAGSSAADLLR